MTNLHYIADEQLGGVEREYAEVKRKANVGDYAIQTSTWEMKQGTIAKVARIASDDSGIRLDGEPLFHSEYATLDPTGNVRIDGTVYRMVDRNATVGEKVLTLNYGGVCAVAGDIHTVETAGYDDGSISTEEGAFFDTEEGDKYAVLEPVEHIEELTLTESDVRNNPRQVIDLIANLAGRLSKLESRVERLGTANQQAYDILARNVETWAQEMAELKARMGDAGRALTAEERREL